MTWLATNWVAVLACNLIHNLPPVCLWCGSVHNHQELSEGASQLENCLNSILLANFLWMHGRMSLGGLAVGGSSSESRAALGDLLRLRVMIPWGWLTHLKVSFRCVSSSFLLVSSQIVLPRLSLFFTLGWCVRSNECKSQCWWVSYTLQWWRHLHSSQMRVVSP